MKRTLVGMICALALVVTACGGSDDSAGEMSDSSTQSAASSTSSGPAENPRGAVEVNLGEQVELYNNGGLVVRINDTRLDATGCDFAHPEVVQAKLAATVETGSVEMTQWLWPSDIYYVDAKGKVAQDLEVTQTVDSVNPCADSVQLIDVPPNSTADGSPTILIPKVTVAIGYHLKTEGVDQRVEWKLPAGWATTLVPPTTEATVEP